MGGEGRGRETPGASQLPRSAPGGAVRCRRHTARPARCNRLVNSKLLVQALERMESVADALEAALESARNRDALDTQIAPR